MNAIKSILCGMLFLAALVGAVWPILKDGELNWRLDMDLRGGVQITYLADFNSLDPEKDTPAERERLLRLSHQRLDSRLAGFEGVEMRVQSLGEKRLLVEVPGVTNIAEVRRDLGLPKVVYFGRVVSLAGHDTEKTRTFRLPDQTELNVELTDVQAFGGNILYDRMEIRTAGPGKGIHLTLPLDEEGGSRMAELTTAAFTQPVLIAGNPSESRKIAMLLDERITNLFEVESPGIRSGVIAVADLAAAHRLKRLLSSGPMPIPFHVEQERSISPLLGRRLQEKGVFAVFLSVALLIGFLAACYLDRPQFIFVYALTLTLWFLALVALANSQILRISLLQVAGLALLLGMNTDALVLVFQDIYQEFHAERRFSLDLVAAAFKAEWMVIFWGMATTIVVLLPLFLQGGLFQDFVVLMALGMALNVVGYFFARLLMSIRFGPDRIRNARTGLSPWLDRLDFTRFRYKPLSLLLMLLSVLAVSVYPGIPLAPIFGGGKALTLQFSRPVDAEELNARLRSLAGRRSQILTQSGDEGTTWAMVKFSDGAEPDENRVVESLSASLGVRPDIVSIEAISPTLVRKTRIRVSFQMFLGLIFLLVLSTFVYSPSAGFRIIVALVHDLLICLGVMAILRIELDLPSIAALAIIAGYSVNDSIVILHKLRQLKIDREKARRTPFDPMLEEDMRELSRLPDENLRRIPARVVITSLTTILPMVVLAALTGGVLWDYAAIVVTGVIAGTLSSIYIVGSAVPTYFLNWEA